MAAPEPRRRLDEFDPVTPVDSDYIVGYRPGAKGIRFPISDLSDLINPAPLNGALEAALTRAEADARYLWVETADQLWLRKALAESLYFTKAQALETFVTKAHAEERLVAQEFDGTLHIAQGGRLVMETPAGEWYEVGIEDDDLPHNGGRRAKLVLRHIPPF